MPKNSHQRC